MKTIKHLLFFVPIFLLLSSCEEDTLPKPTSFITSDGTYMGVVHLAYEAISDAEIYDVYRLNSETAVWDDIAWTEMTNWDDHGYLLSDNKIIPGQEYQYKMRAHSDDASFGSYSDIETGYAFDPEEVIITEVTRDYTESENLIIWTDPNDYDPIQNIVIKEYIIYYATENNLDYFQKLKSTYDLSCEHYVDANEVYYYKIVTNYTYSISNNTWSTYDAYYETESDPTKEGSDNNNDDPEIISYTNTDLGTVVTSVDAIGFTEIKQNGSNIYLGVLEDVSVTGYGTPAVYMLSGNSWAGTGGTLPSDITGIANMGIAVSSSKIYLAALEGDSLYIHESDGSTWSNNLAAGSMGYDDSPSDMDIEVLNDDLYLAAKVYPDWDLKILKWTGTIWETVGGDANGFIATGNVWDPKIENIDGTLYLHYRIDDTFFIKHLNGTSWDTDLEWTQEWLGNIKLSKHGSVLYFNSDTRSWGGDYNGGAYKVTSSSTVENLIPDDAEWFMLGSYAMDIDNDGNVIFVTEKFESAESHYPALYLFDGTDWNTISGDFSDGKYPVSVHADGTDIYYIYGDANNLTSWNNTKSLKSMKLTR